MRESLKAHSNPASFFQFHNGHMEAVLALPNVWRGNKRILILGVGALAEEVYQIVTTKSLWGPEAVAFLKGENDQVDARFAQRDVLGVYDELVQVVKAHNMDTIVVCLENRRAALPMQALLEFKAMGLNVVDGHELLEKDSGRLSIDSLRPSALIFSKGFRRRALSIGSKWLLDLAISIGGLVILAPLLAVVAILIKVDSPGPVFYRQVRIGLRGQPYLIWKFRSMQQDAEKEGPRWAQADDPRVSRVGRWLRITRIDELPQLFNVLSGEMSVVGPRPERPAFVQNLRRIIPYYDIRHTVKPGITGWAQVMFRYAQSEQDAHTKLQYDLYYVKNFSLLLDVKILIHTIRVIALGKGAQ